MNPRQIFRHDKTVVNRNGLVCVTSTMQAGLARFTATVDLDVFIDIETVCESEAQFKRMANSLLERAKLGKKVA